MASWSPDFALFTACAIAALPSLLVDRPLHTESGYRRLAQAKASVMCGYC